MDPKEKESYLKLSKMGLIHGFDSSGYESINWISPLGEDVIESLEKSHNKSRQKDTSGAGSSA